MSELTLPDPKTPLQARAFALLRALDGKEYERATLVVLNNRNEKDTRQALRFMRDHNYIYICRWNGSEPVYKAGVGVDARRPATGRRDAPVKPPEFKIPPPDPLLAALFAPVMRQPPEHTAAPAAARHTAEI